LRLWINTLLRPFAGTYFVLTSMYCLLAFLPYTYYFLIKAPAYAWMPWFVQHQAGLYWLAATAALTAGWNLKDSWRTRSWRFLASVGGLVLAGIYLNLRPFLLTLENSRAAYWWSLASLLPLVAASLWRSPESAGWAANTGCGTGAIAREPAELRSARRPMAAVPTLNPSSLLFPYSTAVLIACVLSAIYVAGARLRIYTQTHTLSVHAADGEFAAWSLISHIVLALALVSLVNLVTALALKTSKPRAVRRGVNGALVFGALWWVLYHFLASAMSFSGWLAHLYAASLGLTLTLWGFWLVVPFFERSRPTQPGKVAFGTWTVLGFACSVAVAFPYIVGDADWSDFLQSTVTLMLWIVVSVCVMRLRPRRAHYSIVAMLSAVLLSAVLYKGLQATEIFWSQPLGATDDEISLTLEAYGGHDNSFQLAHHILGNSRHEVCGDLCRILRDNTNIRDAQVRNGIQLVDQLTPTKSNRPNIFVFVIDSMRPDYLGAYNPHVDYTPNLDAFARDSVVLHNVYSQYAGTSLSEPAVWAGATLLHAHYPQPFSKLNSLDRMLHTDRYRMLVSADEVLSAILPVNDDLVKLDTDKKLWNQLELGSTLRQAETMLSAEQNSDRPVFLYTQPKNVHQFAHNDVPSPTSQHWPERPGLNTRITYEVHWVDSCLGQFFSYLKQRGMYDNSIIIVTSDHGDATGEFGRRSHSNSIWPEVMHVPLIIHLPPALRQQVVYDDKRLATLTDITPTLFYLLGHRPIRNNALYGRPLFATSQKELDSYPRRDLLLASDLHAVYGILTADGRYLYTTYDSPAQSYLFDLASDPNAQHDILTPALKQRYDEEIIEHLQAIGDYYGYKSGVGSLLASTAH